MEGLVILFFIVTWVMKQAKKMQKNSNPQNDFSIDGALQTLKQRLEESAVRFPASMPLDPVKTNELDRHREPEVRYEFAYEGYQSTVEGTDFCDSSLGHNRERIQLEPLEDYAAIEEDVAWSLNFSKDALVQSVVMSEILSRPSQRRWRKE